MQGILLFCPCTTSSVLFSGSFVTPTFLISQRHLCFSHPTHSLKQKQMDCSVMAQSCFTSSSCMDLHCFFKTTNKPTMGQHTTHNKMEGEMGGKKKNCSLNLLGGNTYIVVGVSVDWYCLSSFCLAHAALAREQMFGFEIVDVSVGLSLPSVLVGRLLGLLGDLLHGQLLPLVLETFLLRSLAHCPFPLGTLWPAAFPSTRPFVCLFFVSKR